MGESRRLSGKALLGKMHEFLEENESMIQELKVTTLDGKHANIVIIRCKLLEKFLNMLEETMIVAALQNQHDVISIFLNFVLKQGNLSHIKQHDEDGIEIDVMHGLKGYELKTRKNVEIASVHEYISDYFEEMLDEQGVKDTWWLVFFQQRNDAKGKIGPVCLYYLILIEIPTPGLDYPDRDNLMREVKKMVQKIEKKVGQEDEIDDDGGFLVPVDNILVVDRMRKKILEKDRIILEKDKEIEELKEELKNLKACSRNASKN